MKTTLEAVDKVWGHIETSSLKSALRTGGGNYKYKRPLNSTKEDVVTNSLPITNEQVQAGILNVNIHVPDKLIQKTGAQEYVMDFERLTELAAIAAEVLKEVWSEDYNFSIQQQTVIADDVPGSHYINFRIEFFNINLSN